MKKLYKAIVVIIILLSLCFPVLIILNIWDFFTETLFGKYLITNTILWLTFLIAGALINEIEKTKNDDCY